MPYEIELILVEWFTHIPGVEDTEAVHFENERGTPHAPFISRKPSLMDRDVVDQDITEGRINLIPIIASIFETPQDKRISLSKPSVVMVPMLPAYGHDIGPYLGHGEPHSPEGIGDDLCPTARSDLKKGMTEPFDFDKP